jgi:hypothetical protein
MFAERPVGHHRENQAPQRRDRGRDRGGVGVGLIEIRGPRARHRRAELGHQAIELLLRTAAQQIEARALLREPARHGRGDGRRGPCDQHPLHGQKLILRITNRGSSRMTSITHDQIPGA